MHTLLHRIASQHIPSHYITWNGGGCPKLWYPRTALTPRFREPFAPFRAPAESGHGIMIGFSPPFRGLSPLQQNIHIHICRCHSDTKSLAWVLGRLPQWHDMTSYHITLHYINHQSINTLIQHSTTQDSTTEHYTQQYNATQCIDREGSTTP